MELNPSHRELSQMTSESAFHSRSLMYQGRSCLKAIMAVIFLSPGRWFPHSTCPVSRRRYTCRLATHLSGRVLHGQPPQEPQDKWQGWAGQKLLPDVSIQAVKQRKAYSRPGKQRLLRIQLLILICLNMTLQQCHKESQGTTQFS